MRRNYNLNKGGFFRNLSNINIHFNNDIKKLFLENCENCVVVINKKCLTRVEMLRCRNIKLICKKEIYNIEIDLCCEINIEIENKYKDYVYIFTCGCYDIKCKTRGIFGINLPVKYSWFQNEKYRTNYYMLKSNFVKIL